PRTQPMLRSHLSSLLFFLSLIRPPPRPTLFPYTTLFRSATVRATGTPRAQAVRRREMSSSEGGSGMLGSGIGSSVASRDGLVERSEEHTSELQSLTNLVCRLLLEKKKYTHTHPSPPPSHP